MRFSLNWIRDYVDFTEDPDGLARRLTLAGLPVDRVERPAALPEKVVVARVLEVRRHPNADKLSLCRVDAGDGDPLTIVCGAPNVHDGMYSPLAKVGAKLPNGLTIRKSKIRGEVSQGMLCSEIELGLGDDASGIIELREAAEPGTPLRDVMGEGDVVLDIDIASNRGDCLSHIGVAREVAALTGSALRRSEVKLRDTGAPAADSFSVDVEDAGDCPRFTAHLIRGVTVGPSPAWLVQRLESVGQRSINNVVDVTNFVLQEMGQPLHAFDMDRLGTGRILVRRARAGERITTLDGVDRALDPDVLLITDGARPIAVAGVMGGANTEVHEGTTEIVLEAAFFKPERVLRGSRNLRLDTEAAIRFRRGIDPDNVARAAKRAATLLAEVAGGTVASGMVEVVVPELLAPRVIPFRPAKVGETLGETIGDGEVAERLRAFGFEVRTAGERPWDVVVPPWRRDIFEECDLVEEVARHRGYDTVGTRQYNASAVNAPVQPEEMRRRRVGEVLRGFGFFEVRTTALAERAAAPRAGLPADEADRAFFPVMDPPSKELEGLRVSLLPELLGVVSHNLRHGRPEVRLFELGKIFRREREGERPVESMRVGLAASGGKFTPTLERAARSLNMLEFKGFVEGLLAAFEIDAPKWRPYDGLEMAPAGAVAAMAGDRPAGFVWEVTPEIAARWDLSRPVYLAQLELNALPLDSGVPRRYREPSRYPAVRRDLALVVPAGLTQHEVRTLVKDTGGGSLVSLELFDHYRGKHIPSGHVGLGFSLTFRAADRTLEEKDVDAAVDRIVAGLTRLGISRREA